MTEIQTSPVFGLSLTANTIFLNSFIKVASLVLKTKCPVFCTKLDPFHMKWPRLVSKTRTFSQYPKTSYILNAFHYQSMYTYIYNALKSPQMILTF